MASEVCCRGAEKALSFHALLCVARNCGKQPLCQNKQMDGHSHIHSHSLKKSSPLDNSALAKSMTSNLCAQLGGQPINNSLLSKICLPDFHRRLCCVFFFVFFSADLYCGILANTAPAIGKPHLSNARNKTAPGRLEPCHHKSTLSSAFYPLRVCVYVSLSLPQGATPRHQSRRKSPWCISQPPKVRPTCTYSTTCLFSAVTTGTEL